MLTVVRQQPRRAHGASCRGDTHDRDRRHPYAVLHHADIFEDAGEFDTIGGLVLNLFGSLPREGRVIAYDHLSFRVLRLKGARILEVEVRREAP